MLAIYRMVLLYVVVEITTAPTLWYEQCLDYRHNYMQGIVYGRWCFQIGNDGVVILLLNIQFFDIKRKVQK